MRALMGIGYLNCQAAVSKKLISGEVKNASLSTKVFGSKLNWPTSEYCLLSRLLTRAVKVSPIPGKIIAHEFDYKGVNQVVYEENGVVIRSFPAVHTADGSVSYSLEWNGLKYVFGGDTYPNKWYMEFAKDADVASHELFLPPAALAQYFGWSLKQATYVSTRIHTEPQAFGKVWLKMLF